MPFFFPLSHIISLPQRISNIPATLLGISVIPPISFEKVDNKNYLEKKISPKKINKKLIYLTIAIVILLAIYLMK